MHGNITIQKILSILLHRIWLILGAAVLMGLIFFSYTSFFVTPMYSTSAMIFVQNYDKAKKSSSTEPSAPADAGVSWLQLHRLVHGCRGRRKGDGGDDRDGGCHVLRPVDGAYRIHRDA